VFFRNGYLGFRSGYQGSSFTELLRVEAPELGVDMTRLAEGLRVDGVPHGTTVCGFKFDGGVVMAGDRLATEGMRVASRGLQKVFATDKYSMIAIAGAAGPAIEMAKLLTVELEHYEKIEGETLELDGKANKLSQMIRQNLPAAMQGLVVVPLFAGWDLRRRVGRLWKYDITGGRYEEADFEASGSGGLYAREAVKKRWRRDLSDDDALDLAVEAIHAAADEDRATGGVDVRRGIYPLIHFCTAEGIRRVEDDTIRASHERLLERTQTS